MSGIAGAFGVNLANPESMTQALKQLGQLQQMIAAIPFFMRKLEDKVRKVRLEVTWRDMLEDRMIIVERYVTSLGVNSGGRPPPADGQAQPAPGDIAQPPTLELYSHRLEAGDASMMKRPQRGFTLVEVMIALGLLAMMGVAIVGQYDGQLRDKG